MPRQGGFTLVELMVAIAVLAIMAGLAVPSFQATVNANRLTGSTNELVNALQTARMEAIRRNQRTTVCLSANPDAATPSCSTTSPTGWLVFVDADRNNLYGTGDTLLLKSSASASVRIAASPAIAGRVAYHSDGLARDASNTLLNGVIDLCIATTQPAENTRHLSIGSGSRISVASATSANCTAPADP